MNFFRPSAFDQRRGEYAGVIIHRRSPSRCVAVIEAIFTWPGIGSYVFTAISARDFPVVQGFVIIAGASYVLASTLVDIAGALLDPRIREGERL
jgi:ABC-type antimicrobial peptide transport system permease subunit